MKIGLARMRKATINHFDLFSSVRRNLEKSAWVQRAAGAMVWCWKVQYSKEKEDPQSHSWTDIC